MSSTTQKQQNFVSEPMGDKPVTALPGIGPVLGERLNEAGFDKAKDVLGQYLVMKEDKESFKGWVKDTCDANSKQAEDCANCLKDWSNDHV
ncbi:barrier-to-autointegration factor-like [Haliotis rubra]|uniref:barrier-to-autointegration factor-like n=1 Tax=Haliotis rubra TaxID=36100 RepID=UPI001EE547F7|nr:barrier-to-autointegration factor-like [Haliotis rubra]